jgi:hypothetical protein
MGTSPDIPYEQSLSNIAHEFLRSRVPTLMDSEIGFQLIDKSKGGEKALGAFGFQTGDRSLIIPIVYSDGEVKGHEIIYVVDQNICVPSSEAWVSYLKQKQPDPMGEEVTNNRSALGIRNPPISMINRSPMKFASVQAAKIGERYAAWCHPFINWFAKLAVSTPKDQMDWAPSVSELLGSRPLSEQEAYIHMLQAYPAMKVAAEKLNQEFDKELEKTIDASIDKRKLPRIFGSVLGEPVRKPKALKVLYYAEVAKAVVPYDLTDKEREKLVAKGYVVNDKRKDSQKPKVQIVNQENLNLQNPTDNSLASVLVKPGKFEPCLVMANAQWPGRNSDNTVNVVRLSDKQLTTGDRDDVFVEGDPVDTAELNKFLESLPVADETSLKKETSGASPCYVILQKGKGGLEATCVFSMTRNLGKQGEDKIFEIDVWHSYSCGKAMGDKMPRYHGRYDHSQKQLRISAKAETIKAWQGELVVPADAKVLKMTRKEKWTPDDNDLLLGNMKDVTSILWNGMAKLDVRRGHSVGREFSINLDKPVTKNAAVLHLVEKYELPEDIAEAVLDQVTVGGSQTYGVCKAANPTPWLMDDGKSESPDLPWQNNTGGNWMANPNVDNDSTMNYQLPVQGLVAGQNDPSVWDPRNTPDVPSMGQAMQAAQQGQRDIFNTKSILSIVNKDQSGDMGPIIKCMDSLGRRYLAFCWQREAMNDQYGAADASDIEDSLLENFEGLGDMTIAMYERDIRNGDHAELLKARLTVHSEDTGGM